MLQLLFWGFIMAKFSDDRFELGASRVPALVLGQTKFSTNERERQKTIHAQQGIPTIESDFGKDAKKRGNYLEAGVTEWARDELEVLADGKADIRLGKVDQGYRLDDYKLCASLDAILQIDGSILVQDPKTRGHMELTGLGALEIKTSVLDDFPRHDQVIQLQTQLMCSGFKWGIIAVFGKSQRLTLTPFKADKEIFKIIKDKVKEFWEKVEKDEPYPPLDNGQRPYTINLDHLKTKNEVVQIGMDWMKAKSEVDAWSKTMQECQEALEMIMQEHDAEVAEIGEYRILNKIVKRKAQPEKIVQAKPASWHRRFKIERKNNE